MMTTYNQIKEILKDEIDLDEDRLVEIADSLVPVYNAEVIEEWQQMPIEYNDSWQDVGTDADATILQRMMMDLYLYYNLQVARAYNEIKGELN